MLAFSLYIHSCTFIFSVYTNLSVHSFGVRQYMRLFSLCPTIYACILSVYAKYMRFQGQTKGFSRGLRKIFQAAREARNIFVVAPL